VDLKKDRKKRRKLGAFYTPTHLAEHLTHQAIQEYLLGSFNRNFSKNFITLAQVLTFGKKRYLSFLHELLNSLRILDCASGEGEFLIASYNYLREIQTHITSQMTDRKSKDNRNQRFNFTKNLYGMELEKKALKTCKYKINEEVIKKGFEDQSMIIDQNIIYGDFLKSKLSSWTNITDVDKGFEIIIGNPPWGSNLTKDERENYFAEFDISGNKRNLNSFELFIYKSTQYLNLNNGILAFYLPKNFVRSNQYSNLRKFILEHYEIQSLHFHDLFQDVTQEFISIVGVHRQKVNMDNKIQINGTTQISQLKYYTNIDFIFTTKTTDKEIELLSLITDNKVPLSHYVNVKRGEELSKKGGILYCPKCQKWGPLSSRKENIECSNCHGIIIKANLETRNLISKFETDIHTVPILTGDDFNKYKIESCHYFDDSINFRSKKNKEIYKSPKLVLQKIKSFPCATYDNNHLLTTQNVYNLTLIKKHEKKSDLLLYILAILNSSLLHWFYESQFNLGSKFTNAISIKNLKRLPIPPPEQNEENYLKIVTIVKLLLEADVSQSKDILNRIDTFIIQLYGCESYKKVINKVKQE
jgi:hypothetical protein